MGTGRSCAACALLGAPLLLLSLDGGIERGVVKDVLHRLAVDEGQGEELVHGGNELAAVSEVALVVDAAGVLGAPGLVVDVREVLDGGVKLHVHRVIAVQVFGELVVIDVECLGCLLAHGGSFRRATKPNL